METAPANPVTEAVVVTAEVTLSYRSHGQGSGCCG